MTQKYPYTNAFPCCIICRHIYGVSELRVLVRSDNSPFPHLKLTVEYLPCHLNIQVYVLFVSGER